MPYVKYALTKTIGKKRVFGCERSIDKKMRSRESSKATTSLMASVPERRKLNIDKLRVRKGKNLKRVVVLRIQAQAHQR